VIEQVFGVALQLSVGVQREAAEKALRRALIQRARVEVDAGRAAARDLVRGELVAPAERVPRAGVVGSGSSGAIETLKPFAVRPLARD
jgi:hypothetical protein